MNFGGSVHFLFTKGCTFKIVKLSVMPKFKRKININFTRLDNNDNIILTLYRFGFLYINSTLGNLYLDFLSLFFN